MAVVTHEEDMLAPVVKSFVVPLAPERAFALFTDEIQSWWPLASHSVFGADAVSCTVEGHVGGRIYESHADGRESLWGTITGWEPSRRLACIWHPGRTPETAQDITVVFEQAEGGTRVTLTHSGWERLRAEGLRMRDNYNTGWDMVLGHFGRLVTAHT